MRKLCSSHDGSLKTARASFTLGPLKKWKKNIHSVFSTRIKLLRLPCQDIIKFRKFHNADVRAKRLAEIVLHHANGGAYNAAFDDVALFGRKLSKQVIIFANNQSGLCPQPNRKIIHKIPLEKGGWGVVKMPGIHNP